MPEPFWSFQEPETEYFWLFQVPEKAPFWCFQGPKHFKAFLEFSGSLKCHMLAVKGERLFFDFFGYKQNYKPQQSKDCKRKICFK
jgi:hypothetical protein